MTEYDLLRSLTARRLIATLLRDGFVLARQRGSHRLYRHPDGRRVTVSFHHSSDTFRPGTLRSMLDTQARWTEADHAAQARPFAMLIHPLSCVPV
jgi:predicted RNA binding protein YcfA (HicA-like mRNA interferase family)